MFLKDATYKYIVESWDEHSLYDYSSSLTTLRYHLQCIYKHENKLNTA